MRIAGKTQNMGGPMLEDGILISKWCGMAAKTICFGRFEVDLENRVLRKAGLTVRLSPQPFTVLIALLEADGEAVTREELRRRLWPDGTFLEYEQAINVSIRRLREVLGESGSNPIYIETIPRVGYRWLIPLTAKAQASEIGNLSTESLLDVVRALDGAGNSLPVEIVPEVAASSTAKSSVDGVEDGVGDGIKPQRRWEWWKLAAVVVIGVASIVGVFLFRSRAAELKLARSALAQSSGKVDDVPITRDAPNSKCLNFAGRWRTTPDLSDMQISQSGCALRGSFASTDGAYKHTFVGDSRWSEATVVVQRTDIRNCLTEMNVTFYLDNERELTYVVNGTSGRCELRQNYRETRVWKPLG